MLADLETRAALNQRSEEVKPLIDGLQAANEDSHGFPRKRRKLWLTSVLAAVAIGIWQWWPAMSMHLSTAVHPLREQLSELQQSAKIALFKKPAAMQLPKAEPEELSPATTQSPPTSSLTEAPLPAESTLTAEYTPLSAPDSEPEVTIPRVAGLVEFLDDNFNVEQNLNTAAVATMAKEVLSEMTVAPPAGTSPTLELMAKPEAQIAPAPSVETKQEPVVTTPVVQKKTSPRSAPSVVVPAPKITVAEKPDTDSSSTISLQEENADQSHERAQRMIAEGRLVEAESQWRQALQKNPQHVEARQQLTMFYASRKRMMEAQSVLEEGLALKPNELSWRMLLARIYVDSGAAERAAGVLERGQVSGKFDADYWGLRAAVAQQLQRFGDAVTAYEQALGLRPQEGRWWVGLAIARESAGNTKGAIDAYERALRAERFPPELMGFAQQRLTRLRAP